MRLKRREISPETIAKIRQFRCRMEEDFVRSFAWLATTVYRLAGDWRGWRPILVRTSAHIAVIVVAIVAIGLSQIEWPAQAAPILANTFPDQEQEPAILAAAPTELTEMNGDAAGNGSSGASSALSREAQPHTIIPKRPRLGIITYTIQPGDTVEAIAATFTLSPTTIMWANPAIEDAPDLLRIGQEVVILPINGVYHTVEEGDTLEAIADKYEVETAAIRDCEYNELTAPRYRIRAGMSLVVPEGEKPYIPRVVTSYTGPVAEGASGTGDFQWPVLGRITQGYWYGHRAIDIGAPTGSAVMAADGGYVSFAGWTDVGYGYLIVLNHANDFVTYYAHLSNMYLSLIHI